jgi:hypothetical protein
MFPEDTDNGKDWSFLERLRRAKRIDSWKSTVIGGEMAPLQARKWLGKKWDFTVEMAKRSHFSWVGPYGPALEGRGSEEFVERSDALVRLLGYQYRFTEIRHPGKVGRGMPCKVSVRGVNEGVAPFYYPWRVKLAWLDAVGQVVSSTTLKDDLREWLPGEFVIEAEPAAPSKGGAFRLALGIEDPWTRKPAIRFANDLPVSNGWTILSELEVE